MKYRLKNVETEAVQWDGSEEALEAIKAIIGNKVARTLNTYDWLLSTGEVLSDADFRKHCEPVTEPAACGWEEADTSGDAWNSECGFRFYSYEGCENPLHTFTYCPKCGRKVEERT